MDLVFRLMRNSAKGLGPWFGVNSVRDLVPDRISDLNNKSMSQPKKTILLGLGILIILTMALMAWDHQTWKTRKTDALVLFQQSLSGLGMGAIASPIWNFINYDPRAMAVDDSMTWPTPGGYSYGPDRTATLTYFEERPRDEWFFLQNTWPEAPKTNR
jgi:hypothetical protein